MTQQELLPVEHRSLQRNRLRKYENSRNPERIYAARWLKQNRRRLSSGYTLLEHILCPSKRIPDLHGCPPVSRRDAAVAASVIQWLGTNCGLGFIWEAERAIDRADRTIAERRRRKSLMELRREREVAEAAYEATHPRGARARAISLTGRELRG